MRYLWVLMNIMADLRHDDKRLLTKKNTCNMIDAMIDNKEIYAIR